MWFYLIISIICFSGAGYFIWSNLSVARAIPKGEFVTALKSTKPFFEDYREIVVIPMIQFWRTVVYPFVLRELEKGLSACRGFILKTEKEVAIFRDYVRGKRILHLRGNKNKYWNDLNDHKNDHPGKFYE